MAKLLRKLKWLVFFWDTVYNHLSPSPTNGFTRLTPHLQFTAILNMHVTLI